MPPDRSSTTRGAVALAADADVATNGRAGGTRSGSSSAVDPGVAERRAAASGSTETGMRAAGEPRDRRVDVAAVGPAVAEQHDARHVARRQLGPRRVERGFEIGAAAIDDP